MSDLPEGWVGARPLDVSQFIRGVSYAKGEAAVTPGKGRIALLRANNIEGRLNFEQLQYVPENRVNAEQRLKRGDVVIAMSSGSKTVVGKAASLTTDWPGTFGAFCGVLRPAGSVDARWFGLFFQTREYRATISELSAGTNINNLKRSYFDELNIPLPPLAEQRRIVEKVEALLARVNAARERLARVRQILKRFRQSALAAACSEGDEAELDTILESVRYGTAVKCSTERKGTPVLRIPNVVGGVISHENMKYGPLSAKERIALQLEPGDLLMIRSNGSVALVGRTAMVTNRDKGFSYAGYLMRLRVKEELASPEYVNLALQAYDSRVQIEMPARSTSGVHNINSKEVRQLRIQLPSVQRQREIVRRVEALFTLADEIERRISTAAARADKLTQSILAKAFRGELVPNQAPASEKRTAMDIEKSSNPSYKRV